MLSMRQARTRARKLLGPRGEVRVDPQALDRPERLALDRKDPRRHRVRCTVLLRRSGWVGDYDRIEGQGDTWEEALAQAERSRAQAPYLYTKGEESAE